MANQASMADTEQQEDLTAGSRLKNARIALNLSESDIARKLNIGVQFINALEAEDTSALPAPTFICGYLRSYAKIVDLPAADLLDDFANLREQLQPMLYDSGPKTQSLASKLPKDKILYAAFGAIVLLTLLWLSYQSTHTQQPAIAESNHQTDTLQATENANVGPKQQATNIDTDAQKTAEKSNSLQQFPMPPTRTKKKSTPSVLTTTNVLTQDVSLETANSGSTSANPPTLTSQATQTTIGLPKPASVDDINLATLTLAFTGLCWVEVYDALGQRILYELGKPQQTLVVKGLAPLQVKLGYAPNVQVKFNGKPVDVVTNQSSIVVHLSLGKKTTPLVGLGTENVTTVTTVNNIRSNRPAAEQMATEQAAMEDTRSE